MRLRRRAASLLPASCVAILWALGGKADAPTRAADADDGRDADPPALLPAWGVLYPRDEIASPAPLIQFVTPGEAGEVWVTVRLDDGRTWAASVRGRTLPWPVALGLLGDGEGGIASVGARGRTTTAVFRRRRDAVEDACRCELPGWRAWFSREPSGTIAPEAPFSPVR
jgi:hypothetical protein